MPEPGISLLWSPLVKTTTIKLPYSPTILKSSNQRHEARNLLHDRPQVSLRHIYFSRCLTNHANSGFALAAPVDDKTAEKADNAENTATKTAAQPPPGYYGPGYQWDGRGPPPPGWRQGGPLPGYYYPSDRRPPPYPYSSPDPYGNPYYPY